MALLLLVVVLAGLVAGVAALAGALEVRARSVVAVGVAGFVGLFLLSGIVGLAVRGGDGTANDDPTPTTGAPAIEPGAPEEPSPLREPVIEVAFGDGDELPSPAPVLDRVREGDAPLIAVGGLLANASGSVRQCTADRTRCAAGVPVRTDESGRAQVVVPLEDHIEGHECGRSCVLVVDVDEVGPAIALLFGETAPVPPSVTVEPTAARVGDVVTVTVDHVEPRAAIAITQCSTIQASLDPCGGRAPVVRVVADADGVAQASYEVVGGDVGDPGGPSCRRGSACGITVVDGDTVLAEVAPLRFVGSASVEREGTRIAVGLAAAAVLAAAATWLVLRTDWRAVGLPSTTDDAPDPVSDL
jgi:hypothetical protein